MKQKTDLMTSSGSSASPLLRSRSSRRCCCFFCFSPSKNGKGSAICVKQIGEIRNQKKSENVTTNHRRDQRWPTCEVPPSPFLCGQRMQSTLLPDSLLFVLRHLLVGQGCYATTLCPYSDLQHLAGVSSHVFRENLKTWKILEDTWRPSTVDVYLEDSDPARHSRHRSSLRLPF